MKNNNSRKNKTKRTKKGGMIVDNSNSNNEQQPQPQLLSQDELNKKIDLEFGESGYVNTLTDISEHQKQYIRYIAYILRRDGPITYRPGYSISRSYNIPSGGKKIKSKSRKNNTKKTKKVKRKQKKN